MNVRLLAVPSCVALLVLLLTMVMLNDSGVVNAAMQIDGAAHVGSVSPGAPADGNTIYLPIVARSNALSDCAATGERYGTLSINGSPTDRPAELHADLNLGLRGYVATTAFLGLVNYNGGADGAAPQFPTMFADNRTPSFTSAYQVYNWQFAPPPNPGTRTTPITNPPVTLLGMGTADGEIIRVPDSGYDIGNGNDVLVLYAAPGRITLKYTRDDNVISGYTVHVENVCIDPNLLALYQQWNAAGRGQLPALRGGQAFGRVVGSEILASIQDNGTWLDPRSRKDWWQGR